MKGVFLDLNTVDRGDLDLEPLRRALPEWAFFDTTRPQETADRIHHAEVVVTNKVALDRNLLAEAPRLRLICAAATGTNNIDIGAAAQRGIPVCNARDYATDSVVQHVFALLLTLATRLDAYRADIRAGRWSESDQFCLLDHPIRTLAGMHLGIVGQGVLGQATGRLAEAFGMQVSFARSLRPDVPATDNRLELDDLLPEIDVLSLHLPLTESTRNLIDARRLARMPAGSLLINTARGGLVEPGALAESLRAGHLGGAGIDVLEPEPPPPDHPLLAPDIPNLVLTPHTAWAARGARQNVLDEVRANIEAFRAGHPRNVVAA
ncbi:NAD(P)-dependent oxidoreductase [Thioalkalivibrio paradoxus]|uniref:Glycerate dehydrogenase n=1 Tax=Thioalkalivibrio paradoxus ARh 1 TaxID=713585 RepID=W0DLW0_9GAMM|nr:NAD(P)-dependent oxidoreductase [Thioalkalivibrio paradoxus]AHE97983.1 glycerate dehydrogenase [Thioalkalivibrio paradoxus ARh 1]